MLQGQSKTVEYRNTKSGTVACRESEDSLQLAV
jgi:hypothetical protein